MSLHFSAAECHYFCQLVGMPEFIAPWVDCFYEPDEIAWILTFSRESAYGLESRNPDAKKQMQAQNDSSEFLARCYRRAVADLDAPGRYIPAGFHKRYENWALFEGWLDLPNEIGTRLKLFKDFI